MNLPRFNQELQRYLNSRNSYKLLDSFEETRGSSWQAGACWPVAEALHKVLPQSELKAVVAKGVQHHVVVKWRGLYFDADGATSEKELLNRWGEGEGLRNPHVAPFNTKKAQIEGGMVCPVGLVKALVRKFRELRRRWL